MAAYDISPVVVIASDVGHNLFKRHHRTSAPVTITGAAPIQDKPKVFSYRNRLNPGFTRQTFVNPGPPTSPVAFGRNASAEVDWTAPTEIGSSAIRSYTVTSTPGGFTATVNYTERSAVVIGLSNGTPYTFQVVANNASGSSTPSSFSNSVTPSV